MSEFCSQLHTCRLHCWDACANTVPLHLPIQRRQQPLQERLQAVRARVVGSGGDPGSWLLWGKSRCNLSAASRHLSSVGAEDLAAGCEMFWLRGLLHETWPMRPKRHHFELSAQQASLAPDEDDGTVVGCTGLPATSWSLTMSTCTGCNQVVINSQLWAHCKFFQRSGFPQAVSNTNCHHAVVEAHPVIEACNGSIVDHPQALPRLSANSTCVPHVPSAEVNKTRSLVSSRTIPTVGSLRGSNARFCAQLHHKHKPDLCAACSSPAYRS